MAILSTVAVFLGSSNLVRISIALPISIVVRYGLIVIRIVVDNMLVLDNVVLGGSVVFSVVEVLSPLDMARFVVLEARCFLVMVAFVEVMFGRSFIVPFGVVLVVGGWHI